MCNHLSDAFYSIPGLANTTMTTKQLKETLLATDGRVLACGRLWDKNLGAGVKRVYLEKADI